MSTLLDKMLGRVGPLGIGRDVPREPKQRGRGRGRGRVLVLWRGAWRPVPKNQVGIKRLYMVGPLDTVVKTPWGRKEIARRRARGKVAKQSRKANRG